MRISDWSSDVCSSDLILTDSVFPEKELATYIRNNTQKLQVSLKKNNFVARRQFNRSVFGETRYGYTPDVVDYDDINRDDLLRSEEHTSALQSLMRSSYAVFCLKKKNEYSNRVLLILLHLTL